MTEPPLVPLRERPRSYQRIVVLTGAGISAAAGLPTYRGPGGLWTANPALSRSLVAGVDPAVLWQTLGPMRSTIANAVPTEAHRLLAAFEQAHTQRGGTFLLTTQNIDGLHQRAGSQRVLELHGALRRTRCSSPAPGCGLEPYEDLQTYETPPVCPRCGAALRPAVVLFEEPLPVEAEMASKRALRDVDLFLSIGTSGSVWPASNFVRSAEYSGAHTIFLNRTPLEPPNPAFHEVHLGTADELLARLFEGSL